MTNLNAWKMASAILLLWVATVIAAQAQIFSTLVNFDGTDGGEPSYMALVQGVDGNAYGTTLLGANCLGGSCGTVFKVSSGGTLTTLYQFCALQKCADGGAPQGGLILANDGNFYGTTSAGGVYGWGTVFKITSSGALTTLYSFCARPNCADGADPVGALTQGIDGNMYGTTVYGGNAIGDCDGSLNCGTVFKITPFGALTTIHSFDCSTDGCEPLGGVIQATDGNLYGTASGGGTGNPRGGTVFRVSRSGKFTTLYSFCSQANCADGAEPAAGLVEAADGNLYGTTNEGGIREGTVFKITTGGTLTSLYSFCPKVACFDGSRPQATLLQATDGNFYGTTVEGGRGAYGTAFAISPQGTLTTLHSFDWKDGGYLEGGFLQSTNGILYGTASIGGNAEAGTVFSIRVGLTPFVTFVSPYGKVGQTGGILGQGFKGTTGVSLNGTPASFKVISDTFIRATVPPGATTGYVTVTTPSGTLTSNVPFQVIP